ncbi:BPSL0067 family protein [Pseudoduganella sp. OTU4001]|uniref:BPSL0067 family protein n=1 Tax=Pseudoduganella sp. OTU4001 TaxID=3043854 RepID=UPI00313E6D05
MAYVYSEATKLAGKKVVGNGHCVELVKKYVNVGTTVGWREGAAVVGNSTLKEGTAIATFVHGRYLSRPHGNHAAFFVREALGGIYVIDQWKSKDKIEVGQRFIKSKGKNADGSYKDPSNNADAFSVIER